QYFDTRWVSASEACWRIFSFNISDINPSVFRLQIHLPNQQDITFSGTSDLSNILADERNKKTMLTEYFKMNQEDPNAHNYLYHEFSQYYVWNKTTKRWKKRHQRKMIGRIYTVNLSEGERYYLRILLNNIKGATSFKDLKIINNYECTTFKESAAKRKLIETEKIYHETMQEAAQYQMPYTLRQLFATILIFGEPNNVWSLWNDNFDAMSEDFAKEGIPNNHLRVNAVLLQINNFLEQHHKTLIEYDLLLLILPSISFLNEIPKIILNELNISITTEDLTKIELLNENQKQIFNTVINHIENNRSAVIFVDGPAGIL
ncbi:12965_t:CDS:1, partial [Cetraspora pellucida]